MKKYLEKNAYGTKFEIYLRYRTGARNFLRNHATEEALQEMEELIKELIKERREMLKDK